MGEADGQQVSEEFLGQMEALDGISVSFRKEVYKGRIGDVDDDRHSRDICVHGIHAQRRLQQSKVLIVGLGGLGVEIGSILPPYPLFVLSQARPPAAAKDLVLLGFQSVGLHDDSSVTWGDLCSQFFFKEEDVGKSRVDACMSQLQRLNSDVAVHRVLGPVDADVAVVFADCPTSDLVRVDATCHVEGVLFFSAEARGLLGLVFADVGHCLEVEDTDGIPFEKCIVLGMIPDGGDGDQTLISLHEDVEHNLSDDSSVIVTDVQGPVAVNGQTFKATVRGRSQFVIDFDMRGHPPYEGGGLIQGVKKPVQFKAKRLEEEIDVHSVPMGVVDMCKMDHQQLIIPFFRALHEFMGNHGGSGPRPHHPEDAASIVEMANNSNNFDDTQREAIKEMALNCSGSIVGMTAFIGGFTAQEVMKACMKKFPFNALHCALPGLTPEDCAPTNCRYDGQIAVFGRQFQQKLESLRVFLAGAGALGCEFIKNFAMMGVTAGEDGQLTLTDMDIIENSNTTRQFLFRQEHIGKWKADISSQAAVAMNPRMNVKAMTERIGPESEATFSEEFWKSLGLVVNALDNVPTRRYMDQQCLRYGRALLESGTLGTMANVQLVIPNLSQSYSQTHDPPEKSAPICTVKNFPYQVEHTIQWAREIFELLFKTEPQNAKGYIERPDFRYTIPTEVEARVMQSVLNIVKKRPPEMQFRDCVHWARLKFEEYFNFSIQQLTHQFPQDFRTSTGQPFWAGTKRFPTATAFDAENPTHLGFLISASRLRAYTFGIAVDDGSVTLDQYKQMAMEAPVPSFAPRDGVKIDTGEERTGGQAPVQEDPLIPILDINTIYDELPYREDLDGSFGEAPAMVVNVSNFEKDDDKNFHVDFMTAASNVRAGFPPYVGTHDASVCVDVDVREYAWGCSNYGIEPADRPKTKQIAGRIVPAIVTTTAATTGLVVLELCKVVQGRNTLEDYRDAWINLSEPTCFQTCPMKASEKVYGRGVSYTEWDSFTVDLGPDATLQQLFDEFHRLMNNPNDKIVMCLLAHNWSESGEQTAAILFSFLKSASAQAERLSQKIPDAIEEVMGKPIPPNTPYLLFSFEVELGEDATDVFGENSGPYCPPIYFRLH